MQRIQHRVTDEQIEYILQDLRTRGLRTESLRDNILDHICCIIESELENPGDFKAFYHQNISRFYTRDLAEIEEETLLLLTFKNYYTMKKVMLWSGAASAFLLIAGSFLKLFRMEGAAALLVLGVAVMCFLFLPLLLVLKMKEKPASHDKLILVTGVIIGILYCLSTLFRVMHWPGAIVMTLVTIILSFFVLTPAFFFTGIRRPETRVNTIVSTIILVAATTMQFTLISMKDLHARMHGEARPTSEMQAPRPK